MASTNLPAEEPNVQSEPAPYDYDPYRVLIWIASDSPSVDAAAVREEVLEFLDRDFASMWRVTIDDAPPAVRTAAMRDLAKINFDVMAASDPIIAVKRDHTDAIRIRFASDAGRYLKAIHASESRITDVTSRIMTEENGSETETETVATAWTNRLIGIGNDSILAKWADPATEAVLVSRGMAETLTDPAAKLIVPPVSGQVIKAAESFDKIFITRIDSSLSPTQIHTVEFETLMRDFGGVVTATAANRQRLTDAVGNSVRGAFRPVVRIEDAGTNSAKGIVRASGLILDKESPGLIRVGDVLEPMVRKNDRNGNPIAIGPMDFAYLRTNKVDGNQVEMDFYAGRFGGLQGRKNNRTFRIGVKVNNRDDSTVIRLHTQKHPEEPLIGYEIYDKDLDGTEMTFVGRTDWNGRLPIDATDAPLRLLYVKNGGAVLARLPVVPGHHSTAVADLAGDDMRLQAEAYIRGVQNAIVDLIAIRELFKARINMRLKEGNLKEAEDLLEGLRNQPSNEKLAEDMGRKQTVFLKAIGRNPSQQRKVDDLFSTTRDLLSKHISPKLLNELEDAFIAAKNGNYKPAAEPSDE